MVKKKNNGGRPTKYKKRYCKDIVEYFDQPATRTQTVTYVNKKGTERIVEQEVANKMPTVYGFCNMLGIVHQTLTNWTVKYPEFLAAYTQARQYQEDIWLQNGLLGLYNPGFAALVGKNVFGWKDKQEVDANVQGNLTIEIVKFSQKENPDT